MIAIIAGSRAITDYALVKKIIEESSFTITTVVCGMAQGVDSLGKRYAEENNIPVIEKPAEWKKYGKSAGFIRNKEMAEISEGLICIHLGTPGSLNMIQEAKKLGLVIFERKLGDIQMSFNLNN